MKKLFIYYSNSGNGDVAAKEMEKLGYEIRKVETEKRAISKVFFFGILQGGFLAGVKAKTKLKDFDPNIEGYEEVVIGSPIWNGRFSSPINSVLAALSPAKLNFVLYSGSGEGKPAEKRINKEYPGAKITHLKDPKKYPEELNKLQGK